ncbi:MAG TPA: YceI family protein [Saprospiraceae bacterium]|nr:YceI family protein [Saprospiraceae bacterium]HQW54774.1 YceI family protein [Saprospiraceae bacterium]
MSTINYLLILILWYSGITTQIQKPRIYKFVTIPGSFLDVRGSTNINNFTCGVHNYSGTDTLTFQVAPATANIKGTVLIQVEGFDCKLRGMTADLKRTLKSDRYPYLKMTFSNLKSAPSLTRAEVIEGAVNITLAGVTKMFTINFQIQGNQNDLTISGKRIVSFSDFKLTPPAKVGGMIQTNQELLVEFYLKLKKI